MMYHHDHMISEQNHNNMGKAKNIKKHRKRVGQTSEPVQLANHDQDVKVNLLLTNIGSIHDKKRAEACVLLANVFSKDVNNPVVLDKMSSSEILGKLSMRLVDSVEIVRLHAAGALRNMATSRNQSVSKRLVSIGLMGTAISLVLDGVGSASMSEAQTSYIEQLIACVSNLCASCDEAVEELRRRQFCPNLLNILCSDELHPSIQRAAAQCLHTVTEGEVVISQSIASLAGGVDVLINAAQQFTSAADASHDHKLCALHCLGTLVNICGSLPSGSTAELTQKMQQILPLLLTALEPSDDVLNACISPSIDDELAETQEQRARDLPTTSSSAGMMLDDGDGDDDEERENEPSSSSMVDGGDDGVVEGEGEGEGEGGMDEQREGEAGEEVYVGGEVDKPWTPALEVLEVSAEILANMAVILKEQCGGQEEDRRGDYGEGEGEWGEDEESDERRMEALAALKRAQGPESAGHLSSRRIDLGIFDVRGAIGALISVSTKLHTCIDVLVTRCEKENANFASASCEILSCTDKLMTALSNFLHLVSNWTEQDVHLLMDLLLKQFNSLAIVFRGVTPSSGAVGDGSSATNLWGLSPLLLDQARLQATVRSTLSASVCCLATLHRMPMNPSLLALSSPANPQNKSLRGLRLVTLIRGIASVPFWEVTQHCLDMVSFLSSIELQFNEMKVISNTLLRRMGDPSALRASKSAGQGGRTLCDASILVMEACISSFIDLHSSDDEEVYAVYQSMNAPALLQEAFSDFKNKIQSETSQLDRDEVLQCRETLLNLKRFIKYKQTPP